eukprot:4719209-Pleurochrysis_carterae.AAC.2
MEGERQRGGGEREGERERGMEGGMEGGARFKRRAYTMIIAVPIAAFPKKTLRCLEKITRFPGQLTET